MHTTARVTGSHKALWHGIVLTGCWWHVLGNNRTLSWETLASERSGIRLLYKDSTAKGRLVRSIYLFQCKIWFGRNIKCRLSTEHTLRLLVVCTLYNQKQSQFSQKNNWQQNCFHAASVQLWHYKCNMPCTYIWKTSSSCVVQIMHTHTLSDIH